MNCPKCNVTLSISDRQGVEIDFCPQCRGVWLDRGELDKIIERVNLGSAPQQPAPPAARERGRDYDDDDDDHRRGYEHQKKKRGFLSEIFDF